MAEMKALVPPIKCQGIKTKLVPFILESVQWSDGGRWIEPFMGSGVVAFSLQPTRAVLADSNPHIIRFYEAIKSGKISGQTARTFLEREGAELKKSEGKYYYEVRARFNESHDPLDFLFLNRSCFNGLIRFNRKGGFNVPFNRKPERFAPAYVTKICNQIDRVALALSKGEWEFHQADWRQTVGASKVGDFIYADPPYIARHTDYFNSWNDLETHELLEALMSSEVGFALSTWSHNKYRRNEFLDHLPDGLRVTTKSHFYHLGSSEENRNAIEEALIIRSL